MCVGGGGGGGSGAMLTNSGCLFVFQWSHITNTQEARPNSREHDTEKYNKNNNKKSSFKSNEDIHKKEDGSYYVP